MDPVYEEQRVTSFAHAHGISNFEYRTREKKADQECHLDLDADDPIGTWNDCRQAILWDLTLEEYLVREALSPQNLLRGRAGPLRFARPA
jgi:hypothetical protein